jgi:hypothetical protein
LGADGLGVGRQAGMTLGLLSEVFTAKVSTGSLSALRMYDILPTVGESWMGVRSNLFRDGDAYGIEGEAERLDGDVCEFRGDAYGIEGEARRLVGDA